MGNPMDGDMYEGRLRPGDVGLNEDDVKRLKQASVEARIAEFTSRFRTQDAAQAAASTGVVREMPKYKCHKEVWALKIKEIQRVEPTVEELQRILDSNQESPVFDFAIITPEDEGFAPFGVGEKYFRKHNPQVGGYFVVYADGYKSYSPAKAFEEGYTQL